MIRKLIYLPFLLIISFYPILLGQIVCWQGHADYSYTNGEDKLDSRVSAGICAEHNECYRTRCDGTIWYAFGCGDGAGINYPKCIGARIGVCDT